MQVPDWREVRTGRRGVPGWSEATMGRRGEETANHGLARGSANVGQHLHYQQFAVKGL